MWEFAIHSSSFPFSHHTIDVVVHWHENDSSWEIAQVHIVISVIMFWISARICRVVIPGNFPLELHRLAVDSIQFSTLG